MTKVGDPHVPTVGAGCRASGAGCVDPLFDQQLAHQLAGPLAVVGGDVKMSDCSDHERAQSGDLDSSLCRGARSSL